MATEHERETLRMLGQSTAAEMIGDREAAASFRVLYPDAAEALGRRALEGIGGSLVSEGVDGER